MADDLGNALSDIFLSLVSVTVILVMSTIKYVKLDDTASLVFIFILVHSLYVCIPSTFRAGNAVSSAVRTLWRGHNETVS